KVRDYGSPNNFTEQPDKPFIEYDIVYEDQIFPVTPFIIEEWITSPERNAQEIDEVLESWLQETQLSLEDPESSPYAKKYGIERQLPEPVLRLLSYVDIAGEYNQLTHRYESAQVRLSEQFQQEQAEMRARHKEELSVKMKGGRRKQLLQRQQVELSTAQKAFNSTIGPYESKKR